MSGHQFFELFIKGGVVMWLLLGCSVVAIAVIGERLWCHWKLRFDSLDFHRRLSAFLKAGNLATAAAFAAGVRHPAARVAHVYLSTMAHPPALARDLLTREGNEALAHVEKNLRILSTIAHIATLLGLLGTVAGMVKAFAGIEAAGGAVQPGQLAGGIWEALLTTLMGLSIAIPCIVMLQFFQSRTAAISHAMEGMIIALDEWLAVRDSGKEEPHDTEI